MAQMFRVVWMSALLLGIGSVASQAQEDYNVCKAMTKIMDNHPRHFQDVAGEPILEEPYHYQASFEVPGAVESNITIDERNEDDPETEYYTVVGRYPRSDQEAYEKQYKQLIAQVKSCDFFLYWKEKDHVKFPTDKVPLVDQGRYTFKHFEWGHHVQLTVGLHPNGDNVDVYLRFDAWH